MNMLFSKPINQKMLTELLDRYHLCAFKESSSKSMQPNSLNGHTIEILPVFDPKSATEMLGSKEALIDILEMLITESKADLVIWDELCAFSEKIVEIA